MKKSLVITFLFFVFMLFTWCVFDYDKSIFSNNHNESIESWYSWLDFSDYVYAWYDDTWYLREYSTWLYNEKWNRDWKRVYYFENGQIANELYYNDWFLEGTAKFYWPTYWQYMYHLSWEDIIKEYIEKPEWLWIEEIPSWWLNYEINYKNWEKDGLSVKYDFLKDI